jgi:dihydrolipoamide dehydrogenase
MTISCDHRVMDGAMGARFLQDVKRLLEEPLRLPGVGAWRPRSSTSSWSAPARRIRRGDPVRAARLSVVAIEDDRAGGVCLNWGCIPTKALCATPRSFTCSIARRSSGSSCRLRGGLCRSDQPQPRVADRMAKGVEFLFRKNKITLVPGRGVVKSATTVEVTARRRRTTLEAPRLILGHRLGAPLAPGVTIDEKRVISSNGAVRNETRPGSS